MRRVAQAPRLQRLAENVAERQAAGAVGIVIGNKQRVARIAVIIMIILPLIIPGLQQIVRHGIVVDGEEQIGMHLVGAHRAFEQPERRRRARDQKLRLVEARFHERLFDALAEPQIK